MLEADPAVYTHAMRCVGRDGGARGGGGCKCVWHRTEGWGVIDVGAVLLGRCTDAGVSPPRSPRLPIPLSPFPTAGASARCCLQHSPAAGRGQHGPGEGPQHKDRLGGQHRRWERGSSPCVPIPQGTPAIPPPLESLLRCPRSYTMAQLQPSPVPAPLLGVTWASCPGPKAVSWGKGIY